MFADPSVNFVLSGPMELQTITIAAIGGVGLALYLYSGFKNQFSQKRRVTAVSPSELSSLLSDKRTVLVDIRSREEIKENGNPELKGFSARQRFLPFTKTMKSGEEVVAKFGETFAKMGGVREDSKVVLLDQSGKWTSQAAQEILNLSDFKEIYVVSGGASALRDSGFEWRSPPEPVSLTLPEIQLPQIELPQVELPTFQLNGFDLDKIAESYKERPTLFNTGFALSGLVAAGVVLFNEFDVILEAVGLWGSANVFFRNFLFAEDRERTINDIRSLFNEKIAVNEAGDDLKRLAATILDMADTDPSLSSTKPTPKSNGAPERSKEKVVAGRGWFSARL